jgi:hypothetical protein
VDKKRPPGVQKNSVLPTKGEGRFYNPETALRLATEALQRIVNVIARGE